MDAFVKLYEEFWIEGEFQDTLKEALDGNIDIAIVVFGKFSNKSLKVIVQNIPALDNLSIRDCLASEKFKKRLKECLMRMPV